MPEAENKAIARRIYAAFNARDLTALDELLGHDFMDHTAAPGQSAGIAGIKQAWSQMFALFPGIRLALQDTVADGDLVATRVAIEGEGMPAGAPTLLLEVARIVDGRVVELWNAMR